nr:PH domain-containing protein [uncultured Dyadobacter sp.]
MSYQNEKTYKSRIGPELSIFVSAILVFAGTAMILKGNWIGLGIVLLAAMFILHLFLTTYYQITGAQIRIKSGFIVSKTIPIASITKIAETRNPISSPALSFDRIELKYNRYDSIIISPKNKMAFVADLLRVSPDIEVQMRNA